MSNEAMTGLDRDVERELYSFNGNDKKYDRWSDKGNNELEVRYRASNGMRENDNSNPFPLKYLAVPHRHLQVVSPKAVRYVVDDKKREV
jgi:hypothetical protein